MIKLQIRRKTAKIWQHFITDGKDFIFSKCYCKTNGNKFRVVEDGGTPKNEYNYDEIEVYDDLNSGGAETFTSSLELMKRLSALQYVGFNKDGDVVIADLISSDSSNALEEGSDGKLFVAEWSGGGGVQSVTGSMVDNTAPLNPVILSDNTKQDKVIVVSTSLTAVNDKKYHVVANATFTDPSLVEGKGYEVFVRNGVATIGGVAYSVGSYVFRTYHSGSWGSQLIGATSTETLLQVKGFSTDFVASNQIGTAAEMSNIALSGGTVDYTKTTISTFETGHVGIVAIRSSTNINSGFSFFKGGIVNNGDNHTSFFQFKIISNTNTKGYIGFHQSTTTASPVNSCWLEIVNGTCQFKSRNNTTESASSTFSLSENVWYNLMIEFVSITEVKFKIKTDADVLVSEYTFTTNLPAYNASAFSCAVTFFSTVATTARDLMWLDYVEYRTQKPNHLKDF